MFTDIHLYWELPHYLAGSPVIGPQGEMADKTYGDYLPDARRFAWAIFEVFKKGDAKGRPFIFPRPLVHMSETFFQTPEHREFLNHICSVAGEKGNTCFVFDRGGWVRNSCGSRNSAVEESGPEAIGSAWQRRSFAIQNVTLNLPRLGYKAGRDAGRLLALTTEAMELAAKAHCEKRDFMEKLLSYGESGPLAMLTMKNDGFPYLRMKNAVYLTGVTGLNELIHIHQGRELHHREALACGYKIMSHLLAEAVRLGRQHGMQFLLEQTPAETTAYRFARLDLKYFSPEAGHFVKGNLATGEIYYTNSTHLAVAAPVSPFARAKQEGIFHPLIRGGVMTNLWLNDYLPDPEKMAAFITRVFRETVNDQIVFSPEFSTCNACGTTSRGIGETCPLCGARDLAGIARITQYFSRISGWNKGKLAELQDRKKYVDLNDL